MDVYEITITKAQLQSLPDTERVLVLQFGHVCNELTFLNKLLLIVSDTDTKGIENMAMVTQSMIVIRLFIGKVFEAWRMLGRDYFGNQLSKTLDTELSEEGKKALKALKSYFGKSNLLSTIRNDFSFHYWSDHLTDAMNTFEDSKEFKWIHGSAYANSLFKFSDEFVSVAMLGASGGSEAEAEIKRIIGDLITVSGDMNTFLVNGIATVFKKRLGESWEDFDYTTHKITPNENIRTFRVPFFFQLEE